MRQLTIYLSGALLAVAITAVAVQAQPVIVPLQSQKPPEPTQQQQQVSAPPVAPPQAAPSLPTTTDTAGGPTVKPDEETASQPQ